MKKKMFQKIMSLMLASVMTVTILGPRTVAAAETELAQPAYHWDFESVNGKTVANGGTANAGEAALQGTAAVTEEQIGIDDNKYSDAGNHVLTLSGGNKGTSYVGLPSDIYNGVDSKTGFTWSFWMNAAADIGSYSRVISSANSSNKNEFAYAPYAADAVWNVIFDDTSLYRHIYNTEPKKAVWNYITISVSAEKVTFYVNGAKVSSSIDVGGSTELKARLDMMSTLVNNALGKTCSAWTDPDSKVRLDDVELYKSALSAEEVAAIAQSYGLEVPEPQGEADAREGIYQDGTKLDRVDELTVDSADGKLQVKIWKDETDRYYYSVSREGKVVLECSALGLVTEGADLSSGLVLDKDSIKITEGNESYDLVAGSTSQVDKDYRELTFTFDKNNSSLTVIFRVFADGIGYRYVADGDITKTDEKTIITEEYSEFSFPDKAAIWTIGLSPTYENYEYTKRTAAEMYDTNATYSEPVLASLGADSGNAWVLLSEANVYNEEDPYCASVFSTRNGEKSFRTKFGQYLVQEEDESYDKKTYNPNYDFIKSVTMQDQFRTPWRVAVITGDLESLTNSSLITDLNPQAEGDFDWVVPGGSVWSWWSTSADAIDFNAMKDYIDFASESGIEYCLVDYGWELWDNYEEKVSELVAYAEERNVGILLWYGVNKFDNRHIFDLDSTDAIEKEFAWCEKMGVKGVKVDYINSDSQFAMKVMYDLADLAAKHHLVLNYHGCTNPNGENRTYPNILSSEAVAGAENFKWSSGSSASSLLTLPYTRNVLGPMEFTPTAYQVTSNELTSGFMLAMVVAYESAVQTYAASAYVYEGYQGLPLIADVPTTWDESLLLDGYPGESLVRARRSGEDWYMAAMTDDAAVYEVPLDFLEKNTEYTAFIYSDNAAGTDIQAKTQKVTSDTTLKLNIPKYGGTTIKFSKDGKITKTIYEDYDYYEAESPDGVSLSGEAKAAKASYASGCAVVGYVGGKAENKITFDKVTAKKDGKHELRIYFVSGEPRNLYVSVNGEPPVLLQNLIGIRNDWEAVSAVSVNVDLKKGENKICLYNDTAYTPNIDRIAVRDLNITTADKSALKETIAAAVPEEDEARYTKDSWKDYAKALKTAKEVLADENADQAAVDAAQKELEDKMGQLELKGEEPLPDIPYVDVDRADWFYDAVAYTYHENLMTGLDPTHFGPYNTLSRAQFALVLYRMEGTPAVTGDESFKDITGEEWYGKAVLWAAEAGIVSGYENGYFGPADDITREQMAVMMYRYANYLKEDTKTDGDYTSFPDAASVSKFAEDGMKWAVGKGIISGKGTQEPKTLDPQGKTARAEAAAIIQRFEKAYEK